MTSRVRKLLVANRGEVALRVIRTAQSLAITTVAIASQDDLESLHGQRCDERAVLPGVGPQAYLNIDDVLAAAVEHGADAVHPGYGFLSENPAFARACRDAGITLVGPSPEVLELFGDKGRARRLAREQQLPVLPGTDGATSLEQMTAFFDQHICATGWPGAVIVKALAGGGGRGMRIVTDRAELPRAFDDSRAEALRAYGSGELYVEALCSDARHVEVQVIGDGTGEVSHLWDRDCSVQRRHQKLIERAPSAVLGDEARTAMLASAVRLAAASGLRGLATVEFLATGDGRFFFLEVNPRLQVEHTVTEEILGVDLVAAQLGLAAGARLAELGLATEQIRKPTGCAIQIRVNAETVRPDGTPLPAAGTLTEFTMPTGAGVRVEAAGRTGTSTNPRFDSLLAKIIVHDPSGFDGARRRATHALAETAIRGVDTNLALQAAILEHPDFASGACDTAWLDRNLADLVGSGFPQAGEVADDRAVASPVAGTVAAIPAEAGQPVEPGDVLVVIEAMKMQHPVSAAAGGRVDTVTVRPGDVVSAGDVLVWLDPDGTEAVAAADAQNVDPEYIRPDLAAVAQRRRELLDQARPEAVASRHRRGMRTARENIADLTDDGLLVEYGGLAVAAQRSRREQADLQARTPADGVITGLGRVNGALFPVDRSTCAIVAYDYTVMSGTQGHFSHRKTDRMLELARLHRYPLVLFAEGAGGRPGDTDAQVVAGLHYMTFAGMGALSGVVPLVGIAAGRCFAGNAALLGTCDVIIATADASIGMAGPVMIEGGGLGSVTPEQVGPIDVQTRNGVVDIAVTAEAEAVAAAKKYLSYFQGALADYEVADQRRLRHLIPENRKRVYDIRAVVACLFDVGSVQELRRGFGACVVTALARVAGRPVGVIANDPGVLGGAIDADGADKLSRFLQLCDTFCLPLVSLCDTPGFMVGPDAEKTATVRHFSRMFVLGGHLSVPMITIVLRKGYGLGALGMAAGSFHNTAATVAWPTGEFGGMNLEGAVRIAARDQLAAISDPDERQRVYDELLAAAYRQGSAINAASYLEIDEVIDPAETRDVIAATVLSGQAPAPDGWTNPNRRAGVDTW